MTLMICADAVKLRSDGGKILVRVVQELGRVSSRCDNFGVGHLEPCSVQWALSTREIQALVGDARAVWQVGKAQWRCD